MVLISLIMLENTLDHHVSPSKNYHGVQDQNVSLGTDTVTVEVGLCSTTLNGLHKLKATSFSSKTVLKMIQH